MWWPCGGSQTMSQNTVPFTKTPPAARTWMFMGATYTFTHLFVASMGASMGATHGCHVHNYTIVIIGMDGCTYTIAV